MKDFTNKVAVITGAASGIGRAIAESCIRRSINVVLADVDEQALSQTEAELKALGGNVIAHQTDVSKRSDVEALAQKTIDTFGQVHLLFNNAGVAAGGPAWLATWNDWEWVLGVNLWGVLHGIKIFTPIMLAQGSECHIINTASAAGLVAGGGSASYGVSKHAVVALSENTCVALQQRNAKVGISVLCPGMVRTGIGNAESHRPESLKNEPRPLTPELEAGRAALQAFIDKATPPSVVAEKVFEAIENKQFYIFTHPEWLEVAKLRTDQLLKAANPIDPTPSILKILNS